MSDERHETVEQPVANCNTLNAAKMREALSRILGTVDHLQTRFDMPKLASEEIVELKQIAESAISAPPRNCDLFDTKDKAREAFQKLRGHIIRADVSLWDDRNEIEAFFNWLFAEAKGEKK